MGEASGFTREQMEALAERFGEPEWMRQLRREAFEAWSAQPLPAADDEDWRRTDVSWLDFATLGQLVQPNGGAGECELDHDDAGGCLSFEDEAPHLRLDEAYAAQGVVFCSLHEALRTHEALVRQHFMTSCVPPGDNVFARLHAAFWTEGTFLYVPSGVRLEKPLLSTIRLHHEGTAALHHTLVIVGDDASAGFVEETVGGGEDEALSVPVAEVFVGRGSEVGFSVVQNWDRGVIEVATRRAYLGRDARAVFTVGNLGAQLAKSFVGAVMADQGATCSLYGIYFPEAGQHFDFTTLQDHQAGCCTSDLLFKGALYDEARSIFRGVVKVHPTAQQTDAYQTNNNLLLGDDARADSMPVLEIEADDVKCSHGATLAHLNDEDMFYLRSRGLDSETAERMVIAGFFEPVLNTIPLPSLQQKLREAVGTRIAEH